ncbi:MAG: hypothetical protein NVV63_12365 [Opitutus sp.]|nr:hypothetical protein [Opitutus sp.]
MMMRPASGNSVARIEPAGQLDFEIGQRRVEHRLLPAMQLLARPPPEKGARLTGAGLGELMVGHAVAP